MYSKVMPNFKGFAYMVTSYDFDHRLIRLGDKSKDRNKSDNISSCDILNQTIKIIHGRINADHNNTKLIVVRDQCTILALLSVHWLQQ